MNQDVEMLTAMEIVVASQFPQAVPLMHQAAIVHEVLCHASKESTPVGRILMMRTLATLSSLIGLTLPQTTFAWLSHPEGIEGFMADNGISPDFLAQADLRLGQTLENLHDTIVAINDEANSFQSMLIDIYRASE